MFTTHKSTIAPLLLAALATPVVEAAKDRVKIMSYNVWMFPHVTTRPTEFLDRTGAASIRLTPEKKRRAEAIAGKLPTRDADVFVFEEAFCDASFRPIEEELTARGFSETPAKTTDNSTRWKKPVKPEFLRQEVEGAKKVEHGLYEVVHKLGKKPLSSGVRVFARGEVAELHKEVFANATGDDAMAAKGFVYCKINDGEQTFHVVGTHLQAWENPQAKQTRVLQRQQIRKFVKGKNIPRTEPVFIVGDMNTAKYPESVLKEKPVTNAEYKEMQQDLNCTDHNNDDKNVSFNYETNDWLQKGSISAKSKLNQTMDHILTSNAHLQPKSVDFAIRHDFKLTQEEDAIESSAPLDESCCRNLFALGLAWQGWKIFRAEEVLSSWSSLLGKVVAPLFFVLCSESALPLLNSALARWTRPQFEGKSRDLSDHYPVEATFYFADHQKRL